MEKITLKTRKEFLDNIKAKEGFDLKYICNFDVLELSEYLKTYDNEWHINRSNQDSYLSQKESQSIFITDAFNAHQNSEPYINGVVNLDPKLIELIVDPIIIKLETMVGGKFAKTLLAKLPAGKRIYPHYDQGAAHSTYLMVIRRFHVVITTNENVWFKVESNTQHMKVGECWEVNQNLMHQVWNDSNTDRIHLIVDIFPYKWL